MSTHRSRGRHTATASDALFRERLTAAIAGLVDLLDALDSDPDLEPSLVHMGADGADLEGEHDGCEPDGDDEVLWEDFEASGDDEPSLGSLDGRMDQRGLYGLSGGCDDLELEGG